MGATPQQLVDFYGWKSTAMAHEYISTSKFALQNMATRLAGKGTDDTSNIQADECVVDSSSSSIPMPEVRANFELELPEIEDINVTTP